MLFHHKVNPNFFLSHTPSLIRDRNIPPVISHCSSFCNGNPFKFLAFAFQNVHILNKKQSNNINQTKNAVHFPLADASGCCKFSATDLVVILTAAWLQPCWYIGYFYIWEAICVTDFAIHAACWRTSLETDLRAVFSRWKQLDRSTLLKRGNSITFIFFSSWIACSSQLVVWLEEMKQGRIDGIHKSVCSIKAISYP